MTLATALRLGLVVVLGVAVGGGAYLVSQQLSRPAPRPAPGWELLAELPDPRGETASTVADGRVYVIGGFTGLGFETTGIVSIYDPEANAWSEGPPLPEGRNHAAAAAVDGIVFVSGGAGPVGGAMATMWSRAPGGAWEERAPMPAARSGHRMVERDGLLYVVGGTGGPEAGPGMAGSLLVYDPVRDAWSEGAAMPLNRDHLGAVVVGGEIWAIGGRAGGRNHARVDIYDPATDSWREGVPLPAATSGAAEATIDGVPYLSGGEDPARGAIVDRHWRLRSAFHDGGPGWEELPAPPLAVHGVPGIELGGRFLIIGGSARPGGQSNTAWTGATQAFQVR